MVPWAAANSQKHPPTAAPQQWQEAPRRSQAPAATQDSSSPTPSVAGIRSAQKLSSHLADATLGTTATLTATTATDKLGIRFDIDVLLLPHL
jgi:hypothetical protein